MRTLDNYLLGSFISTFIVTLLAFTFVMSIGAVFEIVELLARGVPWKPVLLILMAIKFVSVVSVFMHLKFDNKIFSWCFYAGLILALAVYIATLATFQFFT